MRKQVTCSFTFHNNVLVVSHLFIHIPLAFILFRSNLNLIISRQASVYLLDHVIFVAHQALAKINEKVLRINTCFESGKNIFVN